MRLFSAEVGLFRRDRAAVSARGEAHELVPRRRHLPLIPAEIPRLSGKKPQANTPAKRVFSKIIAQNVIFDYHFF